MDSIIVAVVLFLVPAVVIAVLAFWAGYHRGHEDGRFLGTSVLRAAVLKEEGDD